MRATHATRKKIEYPYTLDDTLLPDTPSTSYLGVELSSDLRWNKQVKKTVAKGNQTLGVLKRNLRHCPRSIRTWPTKSSCGLNWNMLLLSGTHSLRTTSANWKLYRGGQHDLSATATHYQKYFLKIFLKLECISCPIVSKYKLILRKYII